MASVPSVPSLWPLRFYGPSAISLALCASMVPVPSLWPFAPFYGPSAISLAFAPLYGPSAISGPLRLYMAPVPSLALCAFMVLLAPFLWPSCLCGHLPWPFAPLWPRTISSAFKPFWPQQFLWPWRLFGVPVPSLRPLRLVCPSAIPYDCPSAISLASSPLWLSAIFSWVFASF